MTTLAIIISVVGAAVSAVLWIRSAGINATLLAQRDATLQAEQNRRHALEKAEATAAEARRTAFNAKANAVTTAPDASDLLREAADNTLN